MTPSLLLSKAQNTNLCFKQILGHVKVYDGLYFTSTVSMWNNTVSVEQFSDHVLDLDFQHFHNICVYSKFTSTSCKLSISDMCD